MASRRMIFLTRPSRAKSPSRARGLVGVVPGARADEICAGGVIRLAAAVARLALVAQASRGTSGVSDDRL